MTIAISPGRRCTSPALTPLATAAFGGGPAGYLNAQPARRAPALVGYGKSLAWRPAAENLDYYMVHDQKAHTDTLHCAGLRATSLINSGLHRETRQGIDLPHNRAVVYPSFVDRIAGWQTYLADERPRLARGATTDARPAPSCEDQTVYRRRFEDMPHKSCCRNEAGKIVEIGTRYGVLYEITGKLKFLDAAPGDTLARHVCPSGNERHILCGSTGAQRVTPGREEFGGIATARIHVAVEIPDDAEIAIVPEKDQ